MRRLLELLGCRAVTATSGCDGIALALQETPDLILLDLVMPDLNGPRFLERLRRTHAALPVVIITAYPQGALMLEASQYAPLMVLPKPVSRELLERTVRVALGRRAEAVCR